MTLEQLRKQATASELCLIEAVLKADEDEGRRKFEKIFAQNLQGMTDLWINRESVTAIRAVFAKTLEEFNQ